MRSFMNVPGILFHKFCTFLGGGVITWGLFKKEISQFLAEIKVHVPSCDLMDHGVAYLKDPSYGYDYQGQDIDPRK